MRCLVIVYDHDVKLAGYFQNLGGQCSMTDYYFQHWYVIIFARYFADVDVIDVSFL